MEQINQRRSVRKYKQTAVEEEKLQALLESARLAPSGNNTQPWHFIVVREEENRKAVMEAAHSQKWMMTAPVFIVCVGDVKSRIDDTTGVNLDENSFEWELKQVIRDTSIAIEHIVIEAESLGLSTCWIAWFTQEEIRPVLGIPQDKFVVSVLTLGYADETPSARPRKPLDSIIHYEKWN